MVTLVSKEGDAYVVSIPACNRSLLLKDMLEAQGSSQPISLPNISSSCLPYLVEYMEHYQDPSMNFPTIEKPVRSNNLADLVPAWDAEFANKPHEVLFDVIEAADYMGIEGLVNLAVAKVDCMVKGKTLEEIQQIFNADDVFTFEEEAQVFEENEGDMED